MDIFEPLAAQKLQIAAISSLQRLQHLTCVMQHGDMRYNGHELLSVLPSSLESLRLSCDPREWGQPPLSTAAIPQLRANLQHLQLSKLEVKASLLSGLSSLQRLVLKDVYTAAPAAGGNEAAADTCAFLAAVGQLRWLRHLELENSTSFKSLPPADRGLLSALSASSKLTTLHITERSIGYPVNVLQHIMPEGRQLPHLRSLRVAMVGCAWKASHGGADGVQGYECIGADDTSSLAAACPALEHAGFRFTLSGSLGDTAASLAQLTALKSLSLAGPACNAEMADGVSQLTWLQRLQWDCGPAGLGELQCLTALRGLQELQLGGWVRQGRRKVVPAIELEDEDELHDWIFKCVQYSDEKVKRVVLKSTAQAGSRDVWQQLQQVISDNPSG